jgi:hypothetical protein
LTIRRSVALVLYLVLASVWIYGVVANGDARTHIGSGVEYTVLPLAYFVLAACIASWWAIILPVTTILIALPAKENPRLKGELDWVFFDPVAMLPYALIAVTLGVFAGRRLGRAAR